MRGAFSLLTAAAGLHLLTAFALAIGRGTSARRQRASDRSPGETPPVSILVPAWCERGTVDGCIEGLRALTYPDWEAVIIAGGPDGTFDAARAAAAGDERIRVLEQQPHGKNAALAQGLAVARHETLVFLDADSQVSPDWLDEMLKPHRSGADVSMGNYFPRRETWISLSEQMDKTFAYSIQGSSSLQGSGSVALRRSGLARIGGLPVDVPVGVDWDLGFRLRQAGERVVFAQDAHLITDRPATLREYWSNEVRWRRAHLAAIWRHRHPLLRRPSELISCLYFYAFSGGLALATLAGLWLALSRPASRPQVARAGAVAAVWLLGRRAALALAVAAYSGEARWLGHAWAPPLLLGPTMAASLVATLTARQRQVHFKGPRQRNEENGY